MWRPLALGFGFAVGISVAVACGESFTDSPPQGTGGSQGASGGNEPGGSGGSVSTGGSSQGGSAAAGAGATDWCGPAASLTPEGYCILATEQPWPESPAVDDTHLYWVTSGSVMRVEKNGASAPEPVGSGESLEALALGATQIWWTDEQGNAIGRANKNGSYAATFDVQVTPGPRQIALSATHVYWTAGGGSDLTGAIGRMTIEGTGVEVLHVGLPSPAGLAVDGADVYWLDDGGVHRCNADAGCVGVQDVSGVLTSSAGSDSVLRLDATHVFWNESDAIGVADRSTPGGAQLVFDYGYTQGIAVDGGFLFFADYSDAPDGLIVQVRIADGQASTVAAGLDAPRGSAADADSVYWVTAPDTLNDEDLGLAMKARRPIDG